jgi:nitrogen-specific signal transduction histidine kinase
MLPLVQGDRFQLQQVILNLIINAIEARGGLGERPRELLISAAKAERTVWSSGCRTRVLAWFQRISIASLTPSTPQSPGAWAWAPFHQ